MQCLHPRVSLCVKYCHSTHMLIRQRPENALSSGSCRDRCKAVQRPQPLDSILDCVMGDRCTFWTIQLQLFRCSESVKCEHSCTKEPDLIRKLRSKPTIYSCTVFRQPRPLPKEALSSRRPAADCIVYYKTGWVTEDNSTVYDFTL